MKRQGAATTAIDACIREGCVDLLTEWHHYWKPATEADLWPIGPRAMKDGMELFAKWCPKAAQETFEQRLAANVALDSHPHDGPFAERFRTFKGAWTIRTDRMDWAARIQNIRFASVAGPIRQLTSRGSVFLTLGSVEASSLDSTFVACDGDMWKEAPEFMAPFGVTITRSVVVCRGNVTGAFVVGAAVLLVDGDIDLTQASKTQSCLIRASGAIRLSKQFSPENCTIEPYSKDATAPYKFFEFADVGLSLADDEEGLVVTGAKPGTPFGACGIAKGDLIRAIDDTPAGHSEQFRTALRRALVRQGDCLVTVVRGNKIIDIPVFFPLPK